MANRQHPDARALDRLAEILRQDPWPSGTDFLDYCAEIVRATGRDIDTPMPPDPDDATVGGTSLWR